MVARESTDPGPVRRWFRAWRAMLGRFSRAASRAFAASAAALGRAGAWLYDLRIADLLRPGSAPSVALSALLIASGQVIAVLLAPPGTLRVQALITSLLLLVSLAIVLATLIAEAARARLAEKPILAAWLAGMTPWALAASPLMWPLSWGFSAWLTRRMLARAGLPDRWARRAIAIAWALQLVAAAAAWTTANATTILMMR